MANMYGKMLDSAFSAYYERFKAAGALSKETAVSPEQLFPEGQDLLDHDGMHKMLSMGIVKRVGLNKYWLDEKVLENPNKILLQRLILIAVAVVLGVAAALICKHFGIL